MYKLQNTNENLKDENESLRGSLVEWQSDFKEVVAYYKEEEDE